VFPDSEWRLHRPSVILQRTLCQHRQCARAFQIVKDACHFSIATFDDLEDVQVALMKISSVVILDTSDLGKHARAEAFERDRMQALPWR
jgi:hypothetical protein